jgi:ribosomal protein S18 acetylase RimI-like enzyme
VADLELTPASALSTEELAALFTAGYEDYHVPISVDAATLSFMAAAWDYDLDASRVARRAGEPVGVCVLAVRGDEAWIGGLGVVAAARRAGIGERLMTATLDRARELGVREVRLEVIRENERAIPLYERLGFRVTRELEVWSLPGATAPVEEIPAAEAHARTVAGRVVREPWQRDDASVAKLEGLTGLAAGGGAAVVRVSGGRTSLLQIAGAGAELRLLVEGAQALADSVYALNVPPDHPVSPVLGELGGRVDVTQLEMALELA